VPVPCADNMDADRISSARNVQRKIRRIKSSLLTFSTPEAFFCLAVPDRPWIRYRRVFKTPTV
jgi:hypothetical protein